MGNKWYDEINHEGFRIVEHKDNGANTAKVMGKDNFCGANIVGR